MFNSRRKTNAPTLEPHPEPLGGRSFLQVVADAKGQAERLTLSANGNGGSFVVLTDHGSVFNATGSGLSGRDALRAATALTQGSYLVQHGWPTDQPVYQVGLDQALAELLNGTLQAPAELPTPRGVEVLRGPEQAAPPPAAAVPAPQPMPASPPMPAPVVPSPAPAALPPRPQVAPPVTAAAPPPVSLPERPAAPAPSILDARFANDVAETTPPMAPPRQETAAPRPAAPPSPVAATAVLEPPPPAVALPPVAPRPAPATPQPAQPVQLTQASPVPEVPTAVPPPVQFDRPVLAPIPETAALGPAPGAEDASRRQGGLKHLLTQALLWVLQLDEERGRYTLPQAWEMTRHQLAVTMRALWRPIRAFIHREVVLRWAMWKEDWQKSGEVVKRQQRKGAKQAVEPPYHPSDDFLDR